jgi:hypothetical protein
MCSALERMPDVDALIGNRLGRLERRRPVPSFAEKRSVSHYLADSSEAVQGFARTQVNVSAGQRGGGIAALGQIVDADDFPVAGRFQYGDFPVFTREKQLAFGRDRRRRVTAQGAAIRPDFATLPVSASNEVSRPPFLMR